MAKLFHLLVLLAAIAVQILASGNPFDDEDGEGKPRCPVGYTLKSRQNKRFWCMKYFAGNYTFFEAEAVCRCQGGASLSGIENTNELNWVLKQAEDSFDDIGIKNGGVWVGAYRRPSCNGPSDRWVNKTECSVLNRFQWTDRNTIGTEMWKRWTVGSPHNNVIANHSESCVQLQVSTESANQNLTGTFDNRICIHRSGNDTFITEGFVCGRPPKYSGSSYSGGGGQVIIIGAGKPEKKN